MFCPSSAKLLLVTFRLSLLPILGAAAVEGVGRLAIQKPLEGRCAPGRECAFITTGGQRPGDVFCPAASAKEVLVALRLSLLPILGAAAVDGVVGRLAIQKPFEGRCAPGRDCPFLSTGGMSQKASISGRLMPICVSNTSCRQTWVTSRVGSVRKSGHGFESDMLHWFRANRHR